MQTPTDGGSRIVSVREALLRLAGDATNAMALLRRLENLQDRLIELGADNPYSLRAPNGLSEAATDEGYVLALAAARKPKDPLTRLSAYAKILKELRAAVAGIESKEVKLASRIGSAGTTEAENETARGLSRALESSKAALGRKVAFVIKKAMEARLVALRALVGFDEALIGLWPDGSEAVRAAALAFNAADALQAVAANDAVHKKGNVKKWKTN